MIAVKDNDNFEFLQNQVVYKGFDNLDVSFQGAFSLEILEQLEQAQELARKNNEPELIYLNGSPIHVREGGAKGGFKYSFDNGELGAIWFVKASTDTQQWNVRVSVRSTRLAVHGYKKTKQWLHDCLDNFGCKIILESVGRVDFAVDFKLTNFVISKEEFVAPPKTMKREEGKGRVETVTIGRYPGKLAVVYDKTCEIIESRKPYWWDIWGLDKENKSFRVWRVELRACKRYLKESWGVSSYDELEEKLGDIFTDILNKYRMVTRNSTDTNKARRKSSALWQVVGEVVKNVLSDSINGLLPGRIIEVCRKEKIKQYKDLIAGLVSSYAALHNIEEEKIEEVKELIINDLGHHFKHRKDIALAAYQRAKKRYIFIENDQQKGAS